MDHPQHVDDYMSRLTTLELMLQCFKEAKRPVRASPWSLNAALRRSTPRFTICSSFSASSNEIKVPESEAYKILKVASLGCRLEQPDKHTAINNGNGGQIAWDILSEEKLLRRITTSSALLI